MARVFSPPGDQERVIPELRNLHARMTRFQTLARLRPNGTDTERIEALEAQVNEILARLTAVTKE